MSGQCPFQIEQYLSTFPSNDSTNQTADSVYVVHPQDDWEAMKDRRHRQFECEKAKASLGAC